MASQVLSTFPKDLYRTIHPGAQAFEGGACYLSGSKYYPFRELDEIGKKCLPQIKQEKVPLVEDPFESNNIEKIDGVGTFHCGVDPKALISYQRGLQLLERVVLKDPAAFFDRKIEEIEKVFLLSHGLMMGHMPSCNPGKLRNAGTIVLTQKASSAISEKLQKAKTDTERLQIVLDAGATTCPDPHELPKKLREICEKIRELGRKILHKEIDPIEATAELHCKILETQFVLKGNGRLARGWMNVMLQIGGIKAIPITNAVSYESAVEGKLGKFRKLVRDMIEIRDKFFD